LSDIAIRVDKVSKSYRITHKSKNDNLRELISDACRSVFRRERRSSSPPHPSSASSEEFWALKDVSFEVRRGEVLGIIGRNGAGKSTLLKILSRITRPSEGSVEIKGRVGSLLEVGTGFHPELTGRENIYLNGAILGMRQADIARKFDDIVAFAEIEKFLDMPVKRYSSGMYTRLAFAVAAHLEPEILIVDEVLAVGDAQFQKKCLGKMGEVAQGGRTILFVSHNMSAISRLCGQAVWLEGGCIKRMGRSDAVIKEYVYDDVSQLADRQWADPLDAPGDDRVRLVHAAVLQQKTPTPIVTINAPIHIELEFLILREVRNLILGIHLSDATGLCLFQSCDWRPNHFRPGRYRNTVTLPAYLLADGRVTVLIGLVFADPSIRSAIVPSALTFEAVDDDDPLAVRGAFEGAWPGVVRPRLDWGDPVPAVVGNREQ
jgi:lipopolysaccharide transport system ATP-binding protein